MKKDPLYIQKIIDRVKNERKLTDRMFSRYLDYIKKENINRQMKQRPKFNDIRALRKRYFSLEENQLLKKIKKVFK